MLENAGLVVANDVCRLLAPMAQGILGRIRTIKRVKCGCRRQGLGGLQVEEKR
jgi:hypothetical protein